MARYPKGTVNNTWDDDQDRVTSPVRDTPAYEYSTDELVKALRGCVRNITDSAGANETAAIFGRRYLAMLEQRGVSADYIRTAVLS